jgi:hypothetical protein
MLVVSLQIAVALDLSDYLWFRGTNVSHGCNAVHGVDWQVD